MSEIIEDESFISGYRSVDNEHRHQLSLLAAVRRAVVEARPKSEVDAVLQKLIDFTRAHFASEASAMQLFRYPHYQHHVDEHDRTMGQIEDLGAAHRTGGTHLTLQRVDTLHQWIREHILSTDNDFGRYLVRLGVGPG
ncbi:MAG: hemerythrin family protein [Rhodospirillales bacterium]